MDKISICVLFTGSGELAEQNRTAVHVLTNLNPQKFEIYPVYMKSPDEWILFGGNQYEELLSDDWLGHPGNRKAVLLPGARLLTFMGDVAVQEQMDAAIVLARQEMPALQVLLKAAGLPFVGSDVAVLAMTDDRALTKLAAEKLGLQTAPWKQISAPDAANRSEEIREQLESCLRYPLYVKPSCRCGDAPAVRVSRREQLLEVLESMKDSGRWLLVEESVEGWEVEVAVMGSDVPMATVCAEIDGDKAYIPARIPEDQGELVREAAVRLYTALGFRGVARMSFYVKYDGSGILFESANGWPDFSESSLMVGLFEASGISLELLLEKLAHLAPEVDR